MGKVWSWLKSAGVWIALALGGLLTLGWVWRRQQAKIGQLKDEKALAVATAEMDKLRALREATAERVGEADEAIEILDQQIAEQKRKVVEAAGAGEGLSDEELEAEFKRVLGG